MKSLILVLCLLCVYSGCVPILIGNLVPPTCCIRVSVLRFVCLQRCSVHAPLVYVFNSVLLVAILGCVCTIEASVFSRGSSGLVGLLVQYVVIRYESRYLVCGGLMFCGYLRAFYVLMLLLMCCSCCSGPPRAFTGLRSIHTWRRCAGFFRGYAWVVMFLPLFFSLCFRSSWTRRYTSF